MIGQTFEYDGYNLANLLIIENEIRRPLLDVDITWSGDHHILDIRNSRKRIEVDVALVEKSKEELRKAELELVKVLKKDGLKKLILDDYPGYHNLAILEGQINFERFFRVGQTTLVFTTPDDFIRKNEETKKTFTTKTFTINYEGTKEVQPLMKISGLGTESKIIIEHKDGPFELYNLSSAHSGSYFDINHETGEILFAGNMPSNRNHALRSRWITLYPGSNSFSVISNAELTIEFIYHERMLR